MPVVVNEQVLGLDVPMNDSLCVDMFNGYELAAEVQRMNKGATMGIVPILPCRTEQHSVESLSSITGRGDLQQDGIPVIEMVSKTSRAFLPLKVASRTVTK